MANKYVALLLMFLVVAVAVEAKEITYEEYQVICNRRCYAGCPSIEVVCKKWCSIACKVQLYYTDSNTDGGEKYPIPTKEDLVKFEAALSPGAATVNIEDLPLRSSLGQEEKGTGI